MKAKKFFKALSAGVQVIFEESWYLLRFLLVAALGYGVGALIVWACNGDGDATLLAGLVFGGICVAGLRMFDHGKEAAEYAEENNVDLKTAWRETTPKGDDFD